MAGVYWTDSEVLTLMRMWQADADRDDIAAKLKRSSCSVKKKANLIGLSEKGGIRRLSPQREDMATSFTPRDPCPRCGIRADVGCGHRPKAGVEYISP